jgi:hypothetical protein
MKLKSARRQKLSNNFETPPGRPLKCFPKRNGINRGERDRHYKIIKLWAQVEWRGLPRYETPPSDSLKILTSQFETDVERIKRFKKEARAVSALNHPNIITIIRSKKPKPAVLSRPVC